MLDSDKNLDLTDIETQTAILWGSEDRTTPLAMGEKIANNLPNSTFRLFDEWSHAPYITHPNELAQAILEELE